MMLAARVDCGAHLGELERATDDGQRAAAVDQRADADRSINVGSELKFASVGWSGGGHSAGAAEQRLGRGKHAASAKEIATEHRSTSRFGLRVSPGRATKGDRPPHSLPDNTAAQAEHGAAWGLRFGNVVLLARRFDKLTAPCHEATH